MTGCKTYQTPTTQWADVSARDQVERLRVENAAQRETIKRLSAELQQWKLRCELQQHTTARIANLRLK